MSIPRAGVRCTRAGNDEGLGLSRLEGLPQRAEVLTDQQRAGLLAKRSSTKRRRSLRGALHSKLLLYLRAVSAVAATENEEMATQFQMPPSNASHQAFITMGRGMLEKATANKELLVQRGLSGQLLDDLAKTLTSSSRPWRPRRPRGASISARPRISGRWRPRSPSR